MGDDNILNCVKETHQGLFIYVHVKPKASKNEIVGSVNQRLKIKLHATPEKGAANKDIVGIKPY